MENSLDHMKLKLNEYLFNVILRAKGGLTDLDFSGLLTEDNICFMQIGGNGF